MTAQYREILTYNGKEYGLATEPLAPYLNEHGFKFYAWCTACWRGYTGNWIIENDKLYLVGFHGWVLETSGDNHKFHAVDMNYLFPGQEKVFAEWFTGEIRIPHGEMLQYYHMGYASVYEKELYLEFKNGCLVGQREIENSSSLPQNELFDMLDDYRDDWDL